MDNNMIDFKTFQVPVDAKFKKMSKQTLFVVDIDKDEMWENYLAFFPAGSDPIFKERTEHDCQCCRSFIKNIGSAVNILEDGSIDTIWNVKTQGFYQEVANAMHLLIEGKAIKGLFAHTEKTVGQRSNFSIIEGKTINFDHFHCNIEKKHIKSGDDIGKFRGDAQTDFDILTRSLKELTLDAAETVHELIVQDSIYRGAEHKKTVLAFIGIKNAYDAIKDLDESVIFCWRESAKLRHGGRFKNTVIGSLLEDLSEGKSLTGAVKSFEVKVAPANYKRTTALVTKGMIQKAQKAVNDLGYEASLGRRYAVAEDLTINNVLFADRSIKPAMSVFDEMVAVAPKSKKGSENFDKVEEVHIDKFLSDILPNAESLEVMVKNKLTSNLMSLIAPNIAESKNMFKWDNNFSWTYNGEIADSDLRAKVQSLGGRVDGVFRFSHTWNYDGGNQSLMDLHVFMPNSGYDKERVDINGKEVHDTYPNSNRVGWNNRTHNLSGGNQDVDHTAAPCKTVPVENITFPTLCKMSDGVYIMKVHNWNKRGNCTSGFKAEIEFGGQIFSYEYPKPMAHHEWITVAEVTLKNGEFTIDHKLPEASASIKGVWGITTEQLG
jgi:hypothetical protein